jgi:hypothetical protein
MRRTNANPSVGNPMTADSPLDNPGECKTLCDLTGLMQQSRFNG